MTARRVPPVAYRTPFTMIGVPSSFASGRGPRLSVLKLHATSSLLKFDALIWSRREYLLPRRSAVYIGHSPLLVLGIEFDWLETSGANDHMTKPRAATAPTRPQSFRNMVLSYWCYFEPYTVLWVK